MVVFVEKVFLFALLSWITGNPLVALLAILLLSGAGYGYLTGRLLRVPRALGRWGTIRELQRAVATNPHDATARNDLGRLLVEAGRHGKALPHLEAAVARMAEAPETLYYLGAARLGTGHVAGGRPGARGRRGRPHGLPGFARVSSPRGAALAMASRMAPAPTRCIGRVVARTIE